MLTGVKVSSLAYKYKPEQNTKAEHHGNETLSS